MVNGVQRQEKPEEIFDMGRRHYDRPSRELHREDERRCHHDLEDEEFAYEVDLPDEFFLKGLKAAYPGEWMPEEPDDEIPEPERILPKEKIRDPEEIKKLDLRRY